MSVAPVSGVLASKVLGATQRSAQHRLTTTCEWMRSNDLAHRRRQWRAFARRQWQNNVDCICSDRPGGESKP